MIRHESWGTLSTGKPVNLYILSNQQGIQATVSDYGATLVGLTASDRKGVLADIVLGFDTIHEYAHDNDYFGATVGRVANRLKPGFTLDGIACRPTENMDGLQIHGGKKGFHTQVWTAKMRDDREQPRLDLTYKSKDGEEGYPGNLDVCVSYILSDQGLRIEYRATTDKTTVVSLTNHAYFNLSGISTEDVLDHLLTLNASTYLVTDDMMLPTGKLAEVCGTPLDFTRPTALGARIHDPYPDLTARQGYDHYYIIDGIFGELTWAARILHEKSGRGLDIFTTQPGMQLYTGNFLAERISGKSGAVYGTHGGVCVETSGYINAPHHPDFPPITLEPGQVYEHVTEYRLFTL